MSSTPQRLNNLIHVLRHIWPVVKEVHLNLPAKFRNKETYDLDLIEKLKNSIKNLQIFWFFEDTGPIMKSLPTFKRLQYYPSIDWVVSLDDDVIYDSSIIKDLKYLDFNHVYSGSVSLEKFDDNTQMQLLYGVAGIAWPTKLLPNIINSLETISLQDGCKYHDDYVHSIILKYYNIIIKQRPWTTQKQKNIQFSDDALLWMNRGNQTESCVLYASKHFNLGNRKQSFKDRILSFLIWD